MGIESTVIEEEEKVGEVGEVGEEGLKRTLLLLLLDGTAEAIGLFGGVIKLERLGGALFFKFFK